MAVSLPPPNMLLLTNQPTKHDERKRKENRHVEEDNKKQIPKGEKGPG